MFKPNGRIKEWRIGPPRRLEGDYKFCDKEDCLINT